MIKQILFALCFVVITVPAEAQEWVETDNGAASYNCALIGAVLADFGNFVLARVDEDRYTVSHFFELVIANCRPEQAPAEASPNHESDWIDSPHNESQYDCAVLGPMLTQYGEETLVRTTSSDAYSLSEFFAGLVPDCVSDMDLRDITSRLGHKEGWVKGSNEDYEFNCGYVSAAMAEYGHLDLYRSGDLTLTVRAYFERAVPLCVAREDLESKSKIMSTEDGWLYSAGGSGSNCETVKILLARYGAVDFLRSGEEKWSLFSYYQDVLPGCLPFAVLAQAGTNVRDCPNDDCSVLERLVRETVLTISGIEAGWYQVNYKLSSAFIAQTPEDPAPTLRVEANDGIDIDDLNCFLSPTARSSSSTTVELIDLSGTSRDIDVTLHRPLQAQDTHIVRFAEGDLVEYVAVPIRYPATYEFLTSCT